MRVQLVSEWTMRQSSGTDAMAQYMDKDERSVITGGEGTENWKLYIA